jgi:5-methylcytosine-specific restriction endonuclease McrA
MNPQQQKAAKKKRAYSIARGKYLQANPICEIQSPVCTNTATEISHIKGRARGGSDEPENFKAACSYCGQYVEHNKTWALETGHHIHSWDYPGDAV